MALRNPNNDRSQKQQAEAPAGMTRKGASRAKPVRPAAQTVRVAAPGKSGKKKTDPATMTKDEKREFKRRQRDERDRITVVTNIVLRELPGYGKLRRVWWILLGAGLGLTAVSWLAMFVFPGASDDLATPMGMLAMVCLILAYVAIIGAFVFDWVKVRPMRKKADAQVASMTSKRMQQIIDEDYQREELARLEREGKRRGK